MAVLDRRISSKVDYANKGFAENEETITLHAIGSSAALVESDSNHSMGDDKHINIVQKMDIQTTDTPGTAAAGVTPGALKPGQDDPLAPPGTATLAAKRIILGVMDVALLTSNASQLRGLMQMPYHPFRCFTFTILLISIVLQVVATGFFLLSYWWESEDVKKKHIYTILRKATFFAGSFCIFIVLVANIFIAVFLPMNSGYGEPPYFNGSNSKICNYEIIHPLKKTE